MKPTLPPAPGGDEMSSMKGYQCWFCDHAIEETDAGALVIDLGSLWRWDSGLTRDDDPWQQVYAHSACAKDRLRGATMSLEPELFGEPFEPDN